MSKTTIAGAVTLLAGATMVILGYMQDKSELAVVGIGMLPIAYGFWKAGDAGDTGAKP